MVQMIYRSLQNAVAAQTLFSDTDAGEPLTSFAADCLTAESSCSTAKNQRDWLGFPQPRDRELAITLTARDIAMPPQPGSLSQASFICS